MAVFQDAEQRGLLTLVLGLVSGLAASFIVGTRLKSDRQAGEATVAEETLPEPAENSVPDEAAPVKQTMAPPPSDKAAPAAEAPNTALVNTVTPTALVVVKKPVEKPAEKPSGSVSIVRRANYIAFKGFEFKLYTGKYHCTLDFFDAYYFNFLGDGITKDGVQWFKFKAKNRTTDKAEIKFKLSGSRFSKLVYHVAVVESFEHFLPGNNTLEEE